MSYDVTQSRMKSHRIILIKAHNRISLNSKSHDVIWEPNDIVLYWTPHPFDTKPYDIILQPNDVILHSSLNP